MGSVVLGLDVSSYHVAACALDDANATARTFTLPPKLPALERARAIRDDPGLTAFLGGPRTGWDAVYVEIPGGKHLLAHVAISYVLGALSQHVHGPVTLLRPAEWRKELWGQATWRRGAAKRRAMDEADARGVTYQSDDEAEAFCLALLARRWIKKHAEAA